MGEHFGFTETEVDMLYQRYLQLVSFPNILKGDLQTWYDGYHTMARERLYNPHSVVAALGNDRIGSYWTSSGPYDETELSAVGKLAYLAARNQYDVQREDKAGVDMLTIFFIR